MLYAKNYQGAILSEHFKFTYAYTYTIPIK